MTPGKLYFVVMLVLWGLTGRQAMRAERRLRAYRYDRNEAVVFPPPRWLRPWLALDRASYRHDVGPLYGDFVFWFAMQLIAFAGTMAVMFLGRVEITFTF